MRYSEVWRLSFESLLNNRFRAFLTMVGLVIGVAAVILLVSLGTGAKRYILSEFEGLGTNLIMVQPGKLDAKSRLTPPIGASQRKLTIQDVLAIEKRALNIEAITGIVMGSATVRFDDVINNTTVLGTNERFIDILNVSIDRGSWFSHEEDDYGRRVVVLGSNVAGQLFPDTYQLGQRVRINNSEFRVEGVLTDVGDKLGFNLDNFVFIPTTAALRLFNDDKLFGIRAKARSKIGLDDAVEEIREILKERRDGEEDFTIVTQDAMMGTMSTILSMLTYVLGAIAAISMIVGGVGIMNIMLISVTERIGEIGIRRALGARRRDILTQFLAEATVLSLLGGIAGLILSITLTYSAFAIFPDFDLRPPQWIIWPTLAVSASIGIGFGVWPAWKASRIEILDALRHE